MNEQSTPLPLTSRDIDHFRRHVLLGKRVPDDERLDAVCDMALGLIALCEAHANMTKNYELRDAEIERLTAALSASEAAREKAERELSGYIASAPLCAEHQPRGGTRSGCVVCGLIRQSAALSRIDYLCGEPNYQQCSAYDVHCDEDAVVRHVESALLSERQRQEQLAHSASASVGGRDQVSDGGGTQWIAVTDRLPSNGGDYLILADGSPMVCEFFNVTRNWDTDAESTADPEVTHWMPLPPAPERTSNPELGAG